MDQKLELALVSKYPDLLKDYGGDPRKTCMAFGMECNDGWFDLIDNLLGELVKYDKLVISQIKEKFGGLRIYPETMLDKDADAIFDTICKYEAVSVKTCEECGEEGRRTGAGWIRTLCEECETKDIPIIEHTIDLIEIR